VIAGFSGARAGGEMTREKRVLVVDDDDAIRSLVATVLKRRGLHVDSARNGVEAVELLGTCRYLVLLLDLMMPVMNGWDVLDHLETFPATRRPIVIVLTAGSEPRAFKPDMVAGMVRKPFDIDMLVDTVVGCLASLDALEQDVRCPDPDAPLRPIDSDKLN
jgi:CheY-like chemotaxis protein